MKSSVLAVAVAVLLASLAGCAIVPVGPPVYVGAQVNVAPYYAHPYYGPYYGPRWRRW